MKNKWRPIYLYSTNYTVVDNKGEIGLVDVKGDYIPKSEIREKDLIKLCAVTQIREQPYFYPLLSRR